MRRSVLAVLLLAACKGGGVEIDVDGFLFTNDPTQTAPPSTATISVAGRDTAEFTVEFKSESAFANSFQFRLKGIPKEESLVYRVGGEGLDSVASFPISLLSDQQLILGAPLAGTIQFIKNNALAPGGVLASGEISPMNGIILGMVAPKGDFIGYTGVELLEPSGSGSGTGDGPYYFDNDGSLFSSGQFIDSQGSYVIFNVPPGLYTLRFLGSSVPTDVDVITLKGEVSFGYDIP